jgi:ankyrin
MSHTTRIGTLALLLMFASLGAAMSDPPLIDAVKRQDHTELRELLRKGADVNARQGDGATALHWAVYLNDVEAVSVLLRVGADVGAINDLGMAPLPLACLNRSAEVVGLLLEAGADPNAAPEGRETPLMTAAWTGSVEVVTQLLASGADVHAAESSRQQNALMWAVSEKHPEVVRLLLDHGADIHARSAAQIVRRRGSGGYTPLLFAARVGDATSVRILLDAGANVDDTAEDGLSALALATVRGHVDVATLLLERGADPEGAEAGYTALHWAAGSWETRLTTTDITDDREGSDEWNALPGLKAGKVQLVRALLASGADANARLSATPRRAGATRSSSLPELVGATPFLLAAVAGDTEVMRTLLEAGADVSLTTDTKSTALMAAAGLGRVLGESTLKQDDLLEAAELALALGADVTAADDMGNTALHYAAYHRLDRVVQYLVDEGAALDERNMFGETPLWVSELSLQFSGGGTFQIQRSDAGDVLRSLGAQPLMPFYERARPRRWPDLRL